MFQLSKLLTGAWRVSVAALFGGGLWLYLQQTVSDLSKTKNHGILCRLLTRKVLAIDNVFVWLMIFAAFAIPAALQRKILLYGVLGAIVLRTLFILLVHGSFKSFLGTLYLRCVLGIYRL